MRTDGEIFARIAFHTARRDLFGFETTDLMAARTYEAVKYLLPAVTEEAWNAQRDTDSEAKIREYMPFAWEKANDCRGLSAMRTLSHMAAWTWLAGLDVPDAVWEQATHYGKPVLRAICVKYAIDWRALDDGEWRNEEGGHWVGPENVPEVAL